MSQTVSTRRVGKPQAGEAKLTASSGRSLDASVRGRYRSRNSQLALALVMILLGALVAATLVRSAGHRDEVVAIGKPIAAHQLITADALVTARVSADSSLRTIRTSDAKNVVGKPAATNLVPGSLLTPEQVSKDPVIPAGSTATAVLLKPGSFTPNLKAGDRVALFRTGSAPGLSDPGSAGVALATGVEVYAVTRSSDSTGNTIVSLVLTSDVAQLVAAAASAGQINVALAG